jgi:hypothetical protein
MKGSQKILLIGNFTKKSSGETRNKMGGRRLAGHITDPRNTRMEKTSIRQRRMEASSEGRQAPEGAVAP